MKSSQANRNFLMGQSWPLCRNFDMSAQEYLLQYKVHFILYNGLLHNKEYLKEVCKHLKQNTTLM